MPNGTYTSRPDFIVSAIYEMIGLIGVVFEKVLEEQKKVGLPHADLNWIEGEMKKFNDMTQEIYDKYEGKPVAITLRLAPTLIDRVNLINSTGPNYENLQDFIRHSIAIQIPRRSAILAMEETVIKQVMDARKNRKIGTIAEEELTRLGKKGPT